MSKNDAFIALRIRDFRTFLVARFLLTFGVQIQSLVIGWQIYYITKDPFSLGLIGLAEVIPFFCVALFAGHIADKADRKKIILVASFAYVLCAVLLLVITLHQQQVIQSFGVYPLYIVILITGFARGFIFPAQSAFSAQLIPRELYGNASTWSSVAWQVAAVSGPAIGGLVCGFWGMHVAYLMVVILTALGWCLILLVKNRPVPEQAESENIWQSLSAGFKFVFSNQIILSAISLDMFAVFFGGAVCVLPMFADTVLHIGAQGVGMLRAAPAVGAVLMSIYQAYYPPFKHAGRNLLFGVAGFGLATILFAVSQTFILATLFLLISGMCDNISVIIRSTILQINTPDELRGRVSAVNSVFIGSSNELGSFESGVAARIMGLVPSIIFGGGMTMMVVAGVYKLAPKLRVLSIGSLNPNE
ncbi:MAG: MFS transporter [Ignavibacteria bacterium]|nr:MFS transporter [Ignavibacteria bacterium]